MKSFNFSALKLMTSICLLLFVFLAATKLQAQPQPAKHTTTLALWEVADGNASFALWNKHFKQYLNIDGSKAYLAQNSIFNFKMEKLSGGAAYQVEVTKGTSYGTTGVMQFFELATSDISLACCEGGSDNYAYSTTASTPKDDLIFEEVSKDVYRIKFKHNGTYLTAGGGQNGYYYTYGTTIKMGDQQLWSITGR